MKGNFAVLIETHLVLEARVHQQLRAFLRQQAAITWPHHLTMARLVARALRLGRSALMQVGSSAVYDGNYRLSYLMSLLMWPEPAILVLPEALQKTVQLIDIPRIQQWLPSVKPVHCGDVWPDPNFKGVLLTSPQAWLSDQLYDRGVFPKGLPVVIDGSDDLEDWIRQCLTLTVGAPEWEALMQAYPHHRDAIRDVRIQLTHQFFKHPPNPYHCHLVDPDEQAQLQALLTGLVAEADQMAPLPHPWRQLQAAWETPDPQLLWTVVNRQQGQWRLHSAPAHIAAFSAQLWTQHPLVIIGGSLDTTAEAPLYRQRLGLPDLTCLKFGPDLRAEGIQLYLPDRLPPPNNPQFQALLNHELVHLLINPLAQQGPVVILVGDLPLKGQVASTLAAQFGSRVQVESTTVSDHGILVSGWQFWREHQRQLPQPQLLIIATLPIPSLEDPKVAGRVADYKRNRQDWFRLYLLPTALNELQRAIAPVRHCQGTVALLDSRVNSRSYGREILEALGPFARLHHLEANWLDSTHCP
ncbi:MAG: ATP-dependent DNA helicase [Cyanobacteria bacterium]|nr:ATP-dependent DNA helicase [Cyanobacteriota bacterium]MDA0865620.1 ATP-dependent DNA helicase [Cyanobacteriota bacterium]